MANDTKTRGTQLLRTDDSTPGMVRFYDRRQNDVNKAFVGQVDIAKMLKAGEHLQPDSPIVKAAVHGITQNILDSSNKLEGDERVAFVRKACATVQAGGWASAPVDEAKARENAINALMKLGFTREAAVAAVDKKR